MASPVLRFANVAAGYGVIPAFQELSFSLAAGEGVCLTGPNGCGKSTVLRSLLGLAVVLSGSIELFGREASKIPQSAFAKLGVGYVPQGRGEFPSLTVEENIRLVTLTGDGARSPSIVERVFEKMPVIARLRARRIRNLSGGERTLVALARAFALGPMLRLLVLDEVSSGLSPENMEVVGALLRGVYTEGTAILAAEQNRPFARSLGLSLLEPKRWTGNAHVFGPLEVI